MPRPNRPRSIASEENLARRITYEREQRGWSFAGLAQRMTDAGCAIDQSAIYKIEKGSPRRRISVDELVALSDVFGIAVNDLLVPPEIVADQKALALLEDYRRARMAVYDAWLAIAHHRHDHPRVNDLLEEQMTSEDLSRDVVRESFKRFSAKFGHITFEDIDRCDEAEEARLAAEESKPVQPRRKTRARRGEHQA